MTREARIAMLVGLVFIVMFGLVLGELTAPGAQTRPETNQADLGRAYVIAPLAGGDDYLPEADGRMPPSATIRQAPPQQMAVSPVGEHGSVRGRGIGPASSGSNRGSVQVVIRDERPEREQLPPARRTHKVCRGDTLIGIARKYYGSAGDELHKLIFKANRDKLPDADSLRVGQTLVIPPMPVSSETPEVREVTMDQLPEALRQAGSHGPAARTYTVRPGDSLTSIARRFLNDASAAGVQRIYEANKDQLSAPDDLPAGITIRIPI